MKFLKSLNYSTKTVTFVASISALIILSTTTYLIFWSSEKTVGVSGTFALGDFSSFGNLNEGDTCSGGGGYGDIGSSTRVVVKDGEGTILEVVRLGAGSADGVGNCLFYLNFTEVPQTEFYTFEVANRGELKYSYDDLESERFSISLSLGDVEENIANAQLLHELENELSASEAGVSGGILPSRDEALEAIRANADEKWEDDYRMVQFEVNNQTEAYDWLVSIKRQYPDILLRAWSKWEDDYRMVKFEYENQVEAFESLDNS